MKLHLVIICCLAAATRPAKAQNLVYAVNSLADQLLNFDGGLDSLVRAPLPSFSLGIGYNSSSASVLGGGWNLVSRGSSAFGVGFLTVGSSRSVTSTGAGFLDFATQTTGLSNLVDVSFPMSWSASAQVPGSQNWGLNPGATVMQYDFQVDINNGLLGLNLSAFPSLSLDIRDGNNTLLYSATNYGDLFGITQIFDTSRSGSVRFNYDPANGPLNVTWGGSQLADASLLQILGGSNNSVYRMSNTQFTSVSPVPEPSSMALVGIALMGLLVCRRR